MIEVVYSPTWFYGFDIVIDIISVFVLSFIAIAGLKYYRMDKKNKNFLKLSYSFIVLSIAFLFKILMNFTIYYSSTKTRQIGFVTLTYEAMKSTDTLFFIGYLIYRMLTLIGLFLLFNLYDKQSRSTSLVIIFLIIISTYFAQSAYYVFYFTALMILLLITYKYKKLHYKKKVLTSKLLLSSFGILTLSQLLFIFIRQNLVFYAVAEIVQLIGYSLLLFTFILVLKHGKKKKQT